MSYGKRKQGDRIGAFTLKHRAGRITWLALCDCGGVSRINARSYEVRQARNPDWIVSCKDCKAIQQRDPDRSCRGCGTTDRSRFTKSHSVLKCMACDKAAERNGKCECGRPIRYFAGRGRKARRPCLCGRSSGVTNYL